MPKIIFTSQYMRDAPPAQLENYVKYIGTRDGVDKKDESKLSLSATVKCYRVYIPRLRAEPQPYRQERKLCRLHRRSPHVERIGEHGLFTDAGVPVVLAQVQEDVCNHKGAVRTYGGRPLREQGSFLHIGDELADTMCYTLHKIDTPLADKVNPTRRNWERYKCPFS